MHVKDKYGKIWVCTQKYLIYIGEEGILMTDENKIISEIKIPKEVFEALKKETENATNGCGCGCFLGVIVQVNP